MMATGHGDRAVFRTDGDRFFAGQLGMWIFLGVLAMLFGGTILGVLAIRIDGGDWPKQLPPLPIAVWISTGLLIISSVTMQVAVNATHQGRAARARMALNMTLLLGVLFLVSQAVAWFDWSEAVGLLDEQDQAIGLAINGFHVLTGIHAVHMLGGLIPLAIVTVAVWIGAWQEGRSRGIRYTAMYWHFLGLVWLALVVTLAVAL